MRINLCCKHSLHSYSNLQKHFILEKCFLGKMWQYCNNSFLWKWKWQLNWENHVHLSSFHKHPAKGSILGKMWWWSPLPLLGPDPRDKLCTAICLCSLAWWRWQYLVRGGQPLLPGAVMSFHAEMEAFLSDAFLRSRFGQFLIITLFLATGDLLLVLFLSSVSSLLGTLGAQPGGFWRALRKTRHPAPPNTRVLSCSCSDGLLDQDNPSI